VQDVELSVTHRANICWQNEESHGDSGHDENSLEETDLEENDHGRNHDSLPIRLSARYHLPREGNRDMFLSRGSLMSTTRAPGIPRCTTTFCKGILLDYQNGGQQALGE